MSSKWQGKRATFLLKQWTSIYRKKSVRLRNSNFQVLPLYLLPARWRKLSALELDILLMLQIMALQLIRLLTWKLTLLRYIYFLYKFQVLEFRLQPITVAFWANFYTSKFDIYSRANLLNFECLKASKELENGFRRLPILFKSDQMEDYQRFRSMMQALDLCLIDLDHLNYDKRHLVAAGIYIQLGLTLQVFSR